MTADLSRGLETGFTHMYADCSTAGHSTGWRSEEVPCSSLVKADHCGTIPAAWCLAVGYVCPHYPLHLGEREREKEREGGRYIGSKECLKNKFPLFPWPLLPPCTHHMNVKCGVIPAALWGADDVLEGERVVEALLL